MHANSRGLQSKDPEGDITVIRCVGGAVGDVSVLVMTALAVWEAEVVSRVCGVGQRRLCRWVTRSRFVGLREHHPITHREFVLSGE